MKVIDVNTWNRKNLFEHFSSLRDPFFAITVPVEVTATRSKSRREGSSFFARYLHSCMMALNEIENLKYRIVDKDVVLYDVIHASATFLKPDDTFGFSYIRYDQDFEKFLESFKSEKDRIENDGSLYPPYNGLDCIHCSALPWLQFTGHKEPLGEHGDSVPKLAFSKTYRENNKLMMNVAFSAHHALVDGIHLGRFFESFQEHLNN